jgi:DnaA family protein
LSVVTSGLLQRQLTLEVRLRDEATFDNYLAAQAVKPLLPVLEGQLLPGGEAIVYLCGPQGAGKSHLLQSACHLAGERALYLPLAEMRSYPPEDVLQGVETLGLVCLDDIQAVLGDDAWELALFNVFNRAREAGCRLLVAGDAAPRSLAVELPDLRSRLSWGIVYQLPAAGDEAKAEILRFRAARRGLSLPLEVASYIVSRAPRALEQLLAQLDVLDRMSLAEHRALSIPFVKQVLDL